MEKSPVVIALLTVMMVKSVNSRIDSSRHDAQRAQPESSSFDHQKFGDKNEIVTQRRTNTDVTGESR